MLDSKQNTLLRFATRTPLRRPVLERISPEAAQVAIVADELGWQIKILGQCPPPLSEVETDHWIIRPVAQEPTLPRHAVERAMAVYQAGINPKIWLVAHEKTLALPPSPEERIKKTEEVPPIGRRFAFWLIQDGRRVLGFVAVTAVAGFVGAQVVMGLVGQAVAAAQQPAVVAGAGTAITGTTLVAGVAMLGALAIVDPVLICVTQDDVWIEVDRWT